MKGWQLALIGVILGFLVVGVPYIFLRGFEFLWGPFIYWVLITLAVLSVGLWKISKW